MKKLLLLAASAALLAASAAQAASPAITIDNLTGQALANPPFTLGWSFTTNSDVTVDQLGLFDDSQDGLTNRFELGLWDDAGALLTSAFLGSGTSGTLINQFRYVDVADVVLARGRKFYIGAYYQDGADALIFPGVAQNFATASYINFGESTFEFGGSLARPTLTNSSSPGYFGPNFIGTGGVVPEPATWALMIGGFGLAGAGLRRRKTVTA